MRKRNALTFFVLVIIIFNTNVNAQNKELDSINFKKVIQQMPSFTIHGDNYIITGTTLGETPNSTNSDAKLQLGFKQRLTDAALPWNTYLFFTYKQVSFWDIYKESFPFRETNYNPGLGLVKPFFRDGKLSEFLMFQYEHESNGRDLEFSRSWNYLSFYFQRYLNENITLAAKFIIPIGDKPDNDDITDFRGFNNISLSYRVNNNLILEGDFRKAFSLDWKGRALVGVSYRLSKKSNQYLYLQYFLGYSEDLINYNQDTQKLRIGIAFKDLLFKFKSQY
ncbi:phospholipase A [Yeosuana sp.]|uniref:phospholipase A n=1 Tax=Yeosuana sp. TaxID=2529388 RepID=UPI00404ACEBC